MSDVKNGIDNLNKGSIPKLFWHYAIPSIVATVMGAMYYIIDTIFIAFGSGLGDHAIGALGIVLPIMTIVLSLGMAISAGAAGRVSIFLGEGDTDSAFKVLGASVFFAFVATTIPVSLFYVFLDDILVLIGATEETYSHAKSFLLFFLPTAIPLSMGLAIVGVVRASGYPRVSLCILALGVCSNFILAPLFIFVLDWGMMGVGLSNLISGLLIVFLGLPHILSKKHTVYLKAEYIRMDFAIIQSVMGIGIAPFIIQFMASLSVFFLNNRLSLYGGAISVEGYTIGNQIVLVFIMVFVGLSQGAQPIIGYNYGMGDFTRVKHALVYTIKVGACVGLIGLLVGVFLSEKVVLIFNPAPDLIQSSSMALFILTLTLPLSAFQIITSNFFQNIGKANKSILLSLSRQFIFFIPLLFLCSYHLGIGGIWIALPLADVLSASLSAIVLYLHYKS